MGTTPPTHACAVCFVSFCAETKFEKGASDRNLRTGLQATPSQASQYSAVNGNLLQFEATYRHGTVFVPTQCAYQKVAKGKESPKI